MPTPMATVVSFYFKVSGFVSDFTCMSVLLKCMSLYPVCQKRLSDPWNRDLWDFCEMSSGC